MRGPKEPRRGADLDEVHPIADGAVLIRDGVIVEVGPSRRLENLAQARAAVTIEAAGRVVMPGFVDSHTHLAFPAAALDEEDAVRLVRSSTGQRIEAKTRTYLQAMARHGTTTVEVKTGCGPDESAEAKLLRVLSALHGDPLDLVTSYLCRLPESDAGPVLEWMTDELLPKIQKRKQASFADVACEGTPAHLPLYQRYLEVARSLGFPCKVHADGADPAPAIDLALRFGATSIDHLEHIAPDDARRIGERGVIAALMPGGSFSEGGRNAPARALIDAGAPIAIATNFNPHHSPALNMQTAISLSCLNLGMTIAEALTAATINGAHAVGAADRVGSLEPGKMADLVMLNVSDYRDLRSNLGMNAVRLTMKSGKVIYEEGDVAPRPDNEVRLSY